MVVRLLARSRWSASRRLSVVACNTLAAIGHDPRCDGCVRPRGLRGARCPRTAWGRSVATQLRLCCTLSHRTGSLRASMISALHAARIRSRRSWPPALEREDPRPLFTSSSSSAASIASAFQIRRTLPGRRLAKTTHQQRSCVHRSRHAASPDRPHHNPSTCRTVQRSRLDDCAGTGSVA